MPNKVSRLIAIGFTRAGRVVLKPEEAKGIIFASGFEYYKTPRVLYAFVADETVLYVGYTERPLGRRLSAYTKRGPDRGKDAKRHDKAQALLQGGTGIDIYALANDEKLTRGEFPIDWAAGLESSIIHMLQPPWNASGRRKH